MDSVAADWPQDERFARLRLARSRYVGPAAHARLIAGFGSGVGAVRALESGVGGRYARVELAAAAEIERELVRCERFGARTLLFGERDFPPLLASLPMPPTVLTIMGDPSPFTRPALAVVGARNASLAGLTIARRLSEGLSEAGFVIVSGLARGIDTAAHAAGLAGGTVGVFAGGLDRPYPPENKGLMRRILDMSGCLVSEMPFGWEPRAVDFPRRNRLVAGLSHGLLVVEAALRSGSLISARMARDMGRPVFAVPGSPLDARAEGPNRLIRDGGRLVTCVQDIMSALSSLTGLKPDVPAASLAEFGTQDTPDALCDLLGAAPSSIDELVAQSGRGARQVQEVLMDLELAGRLQRHPDGRVSLIGGGRIGRRA